MNARLLSKNNSNPRLGGWTLRLMTLVGLAALGTVLFITVGGESRTSGDAPSPAASVSSEFWTVRRGDLTLSLLAPGQIKAKESTTIVSQIEGDGKIIWIVPEGSIVQKGDKLVEIEVAELNEDLIRQRIEVSNAEAGLAQALGELEIQKSTNRSDLLVAQNKLELANIDLTKYQEGDFPQQLRTVESEIKVAEAELQRAQDRLAGTEKLLENGYVNKGELEADELSLTKAQIELEKAQNQKNLLEKFERNREISRLKTELAEAEEQLARTRASAESELTKKETAVASTKSKLELEQVQLQTLEDQLANTVIYAPQSGMVVYSADNNRWGDTNNRIEEGAQVRNRQRLIDLPDFTAWQVETRVHESMIQQVDAGMKALVSIEALNNRIIEGHVAKIGVLPESGRWYMPDTKEYLVNLDLTTTSLPLKPGMSAKTQLLLGELKNVVYVPMQSVGTSEGKPTVWVRGETGPRPVPVDVGPNNDKFVQIVAGLKEGDQVLMTPLRTGGSEDVIRRPSEERNENEAGKPEQEIEGEAEPAEGEIAAEQPEGEAPEAAYTIEDAPAEEDVAAQPAPAASEG